jgi:adenine-specific DNA-methyltransferase
MTSAERGTTAVSANYQKLRSLLQELFQLDQADLDFGIYRIMNQKREEVVRFLDKDLLPQVKKAFEAYKPADKAILQEQLEQAIQQANSLGVDPEQTNKVKELRQKIAESAVDVTALENEVFSHLTNFFRRYYSEGDFISLRRYKEGVYAIPYEGEEVKLHWANADQYYVKSTETFRDYTFIVAGGKRVRVHLVAASTEQNNNKEAQGKERRFVLCADDPLKEENGELYIRFEYRPSEGKEKQDELNRQAIETILASRERKRPELSAWLDELSRPAPTEKKPNRTFLEKHLSQYTARNTFDYFIHKDLGGFLRRELDFFIKNEVMHLDDIEHESAPKVEQYLSQIRVIRAIAHKIIAFLEQLENFQKKLWLKKKFVVETNYCITLDRVPEELYPEIAKNDAQREEWVRLFAIDEIEKDLTGPAYSKPLKAEFLKGHPCLVLDTAFFDTAFSDRLLKMIQDLDDFTDGLLVHGENFHALGLLRRRFTNGVKCTFIDPPYNTGGDGFVYKDAYQHSSWMCMLRDRVALIQRLMAPDGAFFQSLDDHEHGHARLILDHLFHPHNFVADITWQRKYAPSNNAKGIAAVIDHLLCYQTSPAFQVQLLPRSDEAKARYANPDNDPRGPWKPVDYWNQVSPEERPNLTYPITNSNTGQVVHPKKKAWKYSQDVYEEHVRDNRIYWGADGTNTVPALKRFLSEVRDGVVPGNLWNYDEAGHTDAAKKELESLLGEGAFETPKPTKLIKQVMTVSLAGDRDTVLDCFAGTGTTGHAVISSNAEEGLHRRFVLVEMAHYFDSIMLPRIKKAIYSQSWKDGKPVSRDGVSHMFKYIRLESYDDALNNLEFKRTKEQATLLDADAEAREQYILSYMLDVESRGSQSLLNIDGFRNPDQYKLRVERNGETQLVNVDLVETFNWLLGLTVKHIDMIRGVRVVEGKNPEGDRVLVLWRNLDELNSDKLDEWMKTTKFNPRDLEFDLIYVNGDNNLENLRRPDQTWKVRLIEEEFQRLMFDVEDV